jgi:hypothetical protein
MTGVACRLRLDFGATPSAAPIGNLNGALFAFKLFCVLYEYTSLQAKQGSSC